MSNTSVIKELSSHVKSLPFVKTVQLYHWSRANNNLTFQQYYNKVLWQYHNNWMGREKADQTQRRSEEC